MFCEKCGNKIQKEGKFCTSCGSLNPSSTKVHPTKSTIVSASLEKKWWYRLLKVIYIFICLQILWIVPAVWSENSSSFTGYYGGTYHYKDTPGDAFWYSVLAAAIFVVSLRLLKLAVLYIACGQEPRWHKEFRRLF